MVEQPRLTPLVRFVLLAAAVWIGAWLPVGLSSGDPFFVLKEVSRETFQRQLYQGLLYGGLFLLLLDSWWRYRPVRPGWGSAPRFIPNFALGLALTSGLLLLYGLLGVNEVSVDPLSWSVLLIWLLSCFAVALVEEALFRGFLLGRLAAVTSVKAAVVWSSLLFAGVHLFRPGDFSFKLSYGFGLFLLGVFLARLAWTTQTIWASVGFHAGLILPNMAQPWTHLQPSWWTGWNSEPLSGALSWVFLLLNLGILERIQKNSPSRTADSKNLEDEPK